MTTRSKGSELLQTDQHFYRSCILYEAICKTSVETAYKRMKTVMPNVDFLDFEFFYYRFLNGNVDLDYDRSEDPKKRGFSDMPIEVVENIVGNLGLPDKLSTRKVCRNLRAVIDKQPSKFQNVSIEIIKKIREKFCEIQFEKQKIEYSEMLEDENCLLKTPQKSISLTGDVWMMALKEFTSVITNPKWSFENIDICFTFTKKRIRQFKSMVNGHKIRVKNIRFEAESLDLVIDLIPIFDAIILKSIDFGHSEIERKPMEKLFEMDQWKNAEKLHFKDLPDWFDIQLLFHARRFTVENCTIDEERLVKIRDILLNSKTFEMCSLKWDVDLDINEFHNLHDTVDRVLRDPPAYNYDMDEYFSESTGKTYKITADLCQYFVELKIEHVVSKL